MDLITLQVKISISIYILIGIGVAIGIYLASEDYDSFESLPMISKIVGIFILSFFWIVTIPAKLTFLLFEN